MLYGIKFEKFLNSFLRKVNIVYLPKYDIGSIININSLYDFQAIVGSKLKNGSFLFKIFRSSSIFCCCDKRNVIQRNQTQSSTVYNFNWSINFFRLKCKKLAIKFLLSRIGVWKYLPRKAKEYYIAKRSNYSHMFRYRLVYRPNKVY